jgi:hypothetical protein
LGCNWKPSLFQPEAAVSVSFERRRSRRRRRRRRRSGRCVE